MIWPSPRPTSSIPPIMKMTGLSAEANVNQKKPADISPVPMIGKILYRPVREMIWPLVIDEIMRPRIIGSIRNPLSVGVAPFTSCRYSGMVIIAPNMPKPTSTPEDGRHRERRAHEQLERDQRGVAHGLLDDDERDDAERAERVAGERAERAPAPLAALLGHDEQRHEREDDGRGTPPVDAHAVTSVRNVQEAEHEEERDDADRQVDQEDPAPSVDEEDLGPGPANRPPISGPTTLEVANTARK